VRRTDIEIVRELLSAPTNAVFGSFTVHSVRLGKTFTSPFSIHVKLKDGRVSYMQYMEDTFGTGLTFRSGGAWKFQSDPNGGEVEV
jgi:uncharacterized protein